MVKKDDNMGAILGEVGCRFRSIIEDHIKDYRLQKGDDVEWLLEPLGAISHSPDLVLDAFKYGTKWESFYQLYFHNKDAKSSYLPYNLPPDSDLLSDIKKGWVFDDNEHEIPDPNPFDQSMIIQDELDIWSIDEIPSIWDEIIVPFSVVGIWQAVLLNEIIALFPKGWHANYLKKTYVFSKADMQQIINDKKSRYDYSDEEIEKLNAYWRFLDMTPRFDQYKKSNYDRLVSYLDREDLLPSVDISGDKAVASYYYWSEWSGFCRRMIPVQLHGQSVAIGKPDYEVLIAYDCGIRY